MDLPKKQREALADAAQRGGITSYSPSAWTTPRQGAGAHHYSVIRKLEAAGLVRPKRDQYVITPEGRKALL